MRRITAMHLLFAEKAPAEGSECEVQCGKRIRCEGTMRDDMVDGRICKGCTDKINGFSVLLGGSKLRRFIVLECIEVSSFEAPFYMS